MFFFDAASFFDFIGRPFGHDVGFDRIHAIDTVVDVLFVFPTILEDVVCQTEQKRNVRARADAHELIGLGGRAGETRVDHNHLAAVFLGMQHVQHADRMRLSSVRANVQRALAVLHVVVGVGHGTITPCVGHTGYCGGVANAGLVIAVVGAPKADEFAQQISLFVVVFGRAHKVHAVRATGFAQFQHLGADLTERRIPADFFVFALDQLHRVTQAVFTVTVFAHSRAFGAMRTQIDGRVEDGFLANPDAVFHYSIDRTPHRAMGANGAFDFNFTGTQYRC